MKLAVQPPKGSFSRACGAVFVLGLFVFSLQGSATERLAKKQRKQLVRCVQVLKAYTDDELLRVGPHLLGFLVASKRSAQTVTVLASAPGSVSDWNPELFLLHNIKEWKVERLESGLISAIQFQGPLFKLKKLLEQPNVLLVELASGDLTFETFASVEEKTLRVLLESSGREELHVQTFGTRAQYERAKMDKDEFNIFVSAPAPVPSGEWSWSISASVDSLKKFFAREKRGFATSIHSGLQTIPR